MPRLILRGIDMFYLMVISGDPNGELISEHATSHEAVAELEEAIETEAENLLWYGIPERDGVPTYAEALKYAREFFYIVESK